MTEFLNCAVRYRKAKRKKARREKKCQKREKKRAEKDKIKKEAQELDVLADSSAKKRKRSGTDGQASSDVDKRRREGQTPRGGSRADDTSDSSGFAPRPDSNTPLSSPQLDMQMALQTRLLSAYSEVGWKFALWCILFLFFFSVNDFLVYCCFCLRLLWLWFLIRIGG